MNPVTNSTRTAGSMREAPLIDVTVVSIVMLPPYALRQFTVRLPTTGSTSSRSSPSRREDTYSNEVGSQPQLAVALGQHAELIALWIGKHHPRLLALADVDRTGAERQEAGHRFVLVIRSEIWMKSILRHLGVTNGLKQQPRKAVNSWTDLKLLARVIDHNPVQRVRPPLPETGRVSRVDDDLLPL